MEQIRMGNFIVAEGYLEQISSNTDVKWNDKDGNPKEAKSVRLNVRIGDEEGEYHSVPVEMFVNKTTKAGAVSKAYSSLEEFLTTAKTIANDGIDAASIVRTGYGTIKMNEFHGKDGTLVSYPQVSASFMNHVIGERNPRIEGNVELAVVDMEDEVDADGVETGTVILRGVTTDGWSAELIVLKANDPSIVRGLRQLIQIGATYMFYVSGDYGVKTETITEEVMIGDPVEKTKTFRKRDLLITGVGEASVNLTEEQIKGILEKRTARIEQAKAKAQQRANSTQKQANTEASKTPDFGF